MKHMYLAGLLGISLVSQAYASDTIQNVRLGADQQTLNISLPANATTGYQWFVQSYNHDLLMLQDYHYVPKPAAKGMTGVGGTAVFTFNVDPRFYDGPQITQVNFIYVQPWSPLQNAGGAQVIVSSTESNNDSMDWQKNPQMQSPQSSVNDAIINSLPTNSSDLGQVAGSTTSNAGTVTTLQSGSVGSQSSNIKKPSPAAPTSDVGIQQTAQNTVPQTTMAMPMASDSSNLGTASASVQNASSSSQWLSLGGPAPAVPAPAPATVSAPAVANVPGAAASGSTAVNPTVDDNSQWLSLPATSSSSSSTTTK